MKNAPVFLMALILAGCGVNNTPDQRQTAEGPIIIEPAGAQMPELPDISAELAQEDTDDSADPTTDSSSEDTEAGADLNLELEQLDAEGTAAKVVVARIIEAIRKSDPQKELILQVFLTDKEQFGVVLAKDAERELIPVLARNLLIRMNQVAPGEDLAIEFYSPTRPLFLIGKAELDSYRRLMTYTANQSLL